MTNKRNYWGWGYADFEFPQANLEHFKTMLKAALQIKEFEQHQAKSVDELVLRTPRFKLPANLESICSSTNHDRASHSYGKAFRDVWRGFHGHFPNPPDYVAFPKIEADIIQLMQFATENGVLVSICPCSCPFPLCLPCRIAKMCSRRICNSLFHEKNTSTA